MIRLVCGGDRFNACVFSNPYPSQTFLFRVLPKIIVFGLGGLGMVLVGLGWAGLGWVGLRLVLFIFGLERFLVWFEVT